MLQSRKLHAHYDSAPNMTPLVDVVMVILVFLMLAGSFGGTGHYLETSLPIRDTRATRSSAASEIAQLNEPLEIRVDVDARGRWTATVGQYATSDPASLTPHLSNLRQQFNPDTPQAPDTAKPIQINPSASASYTAVTAVYQCALQAQFAKVGFTTAH
jgi:biopolymer transport protein ExbD